MDDILKKNIFDKNDLYKLSPDYKPVNMYLRMQIRRSNVKDTHFHEVNRSNIFQRKLLKKTKNSYSRLNKEIIKLRDAFQNINLKNQVMIKYTQPIKSKNLSPNIELLTNNDYNETYNDPYIFLEEYTNQVSETDELIIKSDKSFKLNTKSKPPKLQAIDNNKINHTKGDACELGNSDDELKTNVIRIDCTYVDKCSSPETNERELEQDVCKEEFNQKAVDTSISDLQSLLIMMTLSSKSKCDEDITDTVEGKNNECRDSPKHNSNPTELESLKNRQFVKCEEIGEILNVKPMFNKINMYQNKLLKKYVEKWKKYVNKRREVLYEQRQKTLNMFFDKIEKKKLNINSSLDPANKAKCLVRDYSTYQHRYKVQRHIIALQKAKLEEQNRLIEELKYNKIIKASRQSVDAMKEEVRKTYYEIDRQLKPKIKCLTNELKIPEIDESTLVLQCLKVPQFLQRMEKRAREREEKHAMIRERRRQMEEERLRLKQQAELAKAEMDKDEKMKRIKELREKRKREKIENIRKKQYAEKMRALIVMADLHYEKYLLTKYGISPFKTLMEIKQDNIERAKAHYTFQLKKNVFLNLMWYTEDMVYERNFKAEEFHRKKVLRKAFEGLKQNRQGYVLKKQVAEDYYDLYVTQLVFRKFREAIEIFKRENGVKWQAVVDYYNSNIMFKIFTCWRTLPALNALQREQEARKARWRKKVLQVVPDYTPPED